jgi:hypothetical protein
MVAQSIVWAGGVSGALLAIGTLLRYVGRRLVVTATWTAEIVRLPHVVDGLSQSVDQLTTSVADLSRSVASSARATSAEPARHLESL